MRPPASSPSLPTSPATSARRWVIAAGAVILAMTPSLEAGDGPSLQSIAQRETMRRESLLRAAQAQLEEGQLLLSKDRPEEAAQTFLSTYQSLPHSPMAESMRTQLRQAYVLASLTWARKLATEGRYAQANKAIDNVLDPDVDPGNKAALSLRKQFADSDRYPPALTPQHVANVKDVEHLLTMGGSATDLGQYDKALEYYSQALRDDPYNTAARRGMEHVEQLKSHYYAAARDHTRAKAIATVDSMWEDAVPPSDKLGALLASSNGGGEVTRGGRENIQDKLRSLRISHVEFNNVGLDEAIEYLRVTSRNIDPNGRGVDFIINLEPQALSHQLNLNLSNVPLEDVLHYITEMAGATYRIENSAVVIVSLTSRSTTLITKTYRVPPDFIQTSAVDAGAGAAAPADPFAVKTAAGDAGVPGGLLVRRMGAKEFLEGRGITFPEGASASFSGGSSMLIVRNTADNLNLVDSLVEQTLATGAKQAVITVKMVDVSQTRLNELGFDWELGKFNVPGSNKVFASGGGVGNQGSATAFQDAMPAGGNVNSTLVTAGLRSSGAILGQPSIDGYLVANSKSNTVPSVDSRSPAQLSLLGVYTDPQFQMAMRSLSQSKGVDLVTAPSITVKGGQKSSVRVVREFPYPTQFDPPQIPQAVGVSDTTTTATGPTGLTTSSGSNRSGPITPTTPTAFTTREVGTILEVEPIISADGHTVEISLTPSDVEFEGFIDYGSPISNAIDQEGFDPNLFAFFLKTGARYTQENHIYQPVFRNTHITTAVNVYDGSTVVLGGLVSDRRTDINDKVPIIGDLPLVGRFWQSKVVQSEKRCVLFFVTVKVIDPSGQRVSQLGAGSAQ